MIDNYSADIAEVDFTYIDDRKASKKNPVEKLLLLEGKDLLQHYMTYSTRTGFYGVCCCLFPISAIRDTRFREGKYYEDIDWKYIVLSRCERMVFSNQIKYYYYQSGSSISAGVLKKKNIEDGEESAEELYKLTKDEDYGSIRFLGQVKRSRHPFSLLCRIAMFGVDDSIKDKKCLIKDLTKEHRSHLFLLLKAPLSFSRKVLCVLFAINYNCVSIPLSILKKTGILNGVI